MSYPKCEIPKEICNLRDENGRCTISTICQKVIDACTGCNRIINGYCTAYINPKVKWSNGKTCPLASHIERKKTNIGKHRIGQQKQRRRK